MKGPAEAEPHSGMRDAQQPATHFALALNSIALPLNGMCTRTRVALMNLSVLKFGSTLPPVVATSFACDAI